MQVQAKKKADREKKVDEQLALVPDNENIPSMRLLTTKELSRLTTIPYWRLLQLVAAGKGPPHFRVGSTLRFPQSGVVDWILEQTNNHEESV